MSTTLTSTLSCDRIPEFMLPAQDGVPTSFYERYCGHPTVIVLAQDSDRLTPFAPLLESIPMLGLIPGNTGMAVAAAIPAMEDYGRLTHMLGGGSGNGEAVACLLDARMRLRQRIDSATPEAVATAFDRLASEEHRQDLVIVRDGVAPVLMLPDVLDAALCARLIAAHEAENVESGMIRMVGGQPQLVPDPSAKKRRDHRLEDPALVDAVNLAVSRRVLPAIAAAFNYTVTRLEGFKVVAYDGDTGGYFRLHRDNISPDARHRRFAMTINLDDDYDGGCLAFPEFGPTRYRPLPGGAIVFSGALLHEATAVTRGRRHVLLTFMWGDETAT